MDLDIIILSEVRKWKINIIWYHLYVESKKKKDTNELICRIERDFRCWKLTYGYQRGQLVGRNGLGVWYWHMHTVVYGKTGQQGPAV